MMTTSEADLLSLFRTYIEDKDLTDLFETEDESEKTLLLTELLHNFMHDVELCNTHRDDDFKFLEFAMTLRNCL